LAVINGVVTR